MQKASTKQIGFTLVEMALVLVIIGLVIGGIMVGRDMIHSAEVRSTIRQKERFETAVNTFVLKYGNLPGDVPNASAVGLPVLGYPAGCSTSGQGIIDDEHTVNANYCFFHHLNDASLISEKINYSNSK